MNRQQTEVGERETERRDNPLQNGRQDRNAPERVWSASSQPLTVFAHRLTRGLDNKSKQVKKHSTKRQTVQIGTWVEEPIREEVDRMASDLGLTRSAMAAELLKQAVHQKLHITHAKPIGRIVDTAVTKALQRLLPFIIQISYDTNQSQILNGHILGQILKNDEELKRIRDRTAKLARKNIFHIRPHIEELTEAAKRWFTNLLGEEVAGVG
jgi:hypothetical protein